MFRLIPTIAVAAAIGIAANAHAGGCGASSSAGGVAATQYQATAPSSGGTRRFSYEPSMRSYSSPGMRYRSSPSRGFSYGSRDAGSKIRGDY